MLAQLSCPRCGLPLQPIALPARPAVVYQFEDCLRRCDTCGVGYSNARNNPTIIYQDPLDNIPAQAREGIDVVLAQSLSEANRQTKRRRLGFSTSEDAVTWVVFGYLARRAPAALSAFARRLLDLSNRGTPQVLLWGAPVPPNDDAGLKLRQRLVTLLAKIEGVPRSEPDVVLDYGEAGVVIIEVKLYSANDELKPSQAGKFDTYLANTLAFSDPTEVKHSRMYELARNWRIGWDLADGRPLRLVNLGPPKLFKQSTRLDSFEKGLAKSAVQSFHRLAWSSFLQCVASERDGIPVWLEEWLAQHDLKQA
jgi:hypothetical protein